jgi:glycosyltransferase involved in cell wall biosynthesis
MKKNLLWISLCAPYDEVAHGGGKTHNFYLKQLFESKLFNIHLITFCELDEYDKAKTDLNKYGISNEVIPWTHCINVENIKRKFQLWDMEYNPVNKYGGATNKYYWDKIIEALKNVDFVPDLVLLQWTEIVLFVDKIKKIYPNAKLVCIEEDVKFLALQRQVNLCTNLFDKAIKKLRYLMLKNTEIKSLQLADLIIAYSNKDKNLLPENLKKRVLVVSPYFEDMSYCRRNVANKDIVFYGAMSRKDNYDSAIWFIENVFNNIQDKEIRFIIVGSKPAEVLYKYKNDRVIITGYVESVKPFFENSVCLVAPLVSGAGIKIKVLEALSAGIPVLTNSIGIEGIDAVDKCHYLYCEEKCDYLEAINDIINQKIDISTLSENAKRMIAQKYDLKKDSIRFVAHIRELVGAQQYES